MLVHLDANARLEDRTVILGAAGFVGGAIRARLESAGADVLGLSSKDLDLLAPDAAEALRGILRDGDRLVFVSALAPCKDAPTLSRNVRMAEAVCAGSAGIELSQLVYVSSDAVYADDENPVSEKSAAAPSSLHGAMHRVRELMVQHGVSAPLAILRPSLLYGALDPHDGYGPNRFRRLAREGSDIRLFGDGEETRDHVFIDDVGELALAVLRHKSEGTLNLATGQSTSFGDVARKVVEIFESESAVVGTPRQNPVTHRHFDITATHKAFPSFRYTPLEEGLRKTRERAEA